MAAGLAVAGLAWMAWPFADPNPHLYPPIEHPDGTTEFRLINAGPDRVDGTADDQHWVLRMPAGLWVHTMDEGRTEQQKKDNPDYPYNASFSLIVGLPDFDFVQDPYEGSLQDNLRVAIAARVLPYGTGKFRGRPDLTFSSQHDLKANFNCRKDEQVGPGVFRLRPPDQGEIRKLRARYDPDRAPGKYFLPPRCESRNVYGRPRHHYAVYDASNRPIGLGTCSLLRQADTVTTCTFRFWMRLDRELQFSLSGPHVPQLQSIHARITDLLLNATNRGKSIYLLAGGHRPRVGFGQGLSARRAGPWAACCAVARRFGTPPGRPGTSIRTATAPPAPPPGPCHSSAC